MNLGYKVTIECGTCKELAVFTTGDILVAVAAWHYCHEHGHGRVVPVSA